MDTSNLKNKRKLEEEVSIDDEKIKQSELFKEKGNELYRKLEYDEALDYYFRSITLNPKDHRCYGNIGQILILKERYPEAKEVLQAAIELNSNYAKAYYRLGLVEKHLKNYDEALRNFDKVLKLDSNNKQTIKECEEIKRSLGLDKIQNNSNDKHHQTNLINKLSFGDSRNVSSSDKSVNGFESVSSNKTIDSKNVSTTSKTSMNSSTKASSNKNDFKNATYKSQNVSNKSTKDITNINFPKINIPTKLPDTLPKTSYQFNLFWREIKDNQLKIDYLTFVGPIHFLKLFQKNLEPDFISELIVLFQSMDKQLVFDLLHSIAKIDKFDISLMFLSKQEKQMLKQIIDSLDQQNVNVLIDLYKI